MLNLMETVPKQLYTRTGCEVVIWSNRGNKEYPIIGGVTGIDGIVRPYQWTSDGEVDPEMGHSWDLELVDMELHTGSFFVNFYDNMRPVCHDNRKNADDSAGKTRRACVEIKYSYRNGDGLEY